MNKNKGRPIPGMTAKAKGTMLGALLVTLASNPPAREEILPVRLGSTHREEMAVVVCNFPGPEIQTVDVRPAVIDIKGQRWLPSGAARFWTTNRLLSKFNSFGENMNSLLKKLCIATFCLASFGAFAQGTPALEVRCGKYLKAAPKDKAELDGIIIGYFQGYSQGVAVGSNNDRRALTLRGASTKDMFLFVQLYCRNHPEAMIQGPLLTYIIAADSDSLDALRMLK